MDRLDLSSLAWTFGCIERESLFTERAFQARVRQRLGETLLRSPAKPMLRTSTYRATW
jgi:hypothetical protein